MKKNIIFSLLIIMTFLSTNLSFVFGQTGGSGSGQTGGLNCSSAKPTNIPEVFKFFGCIFNKYLIPFLVSLALIIFLSGIVRFIASGDNDEKRVAGKNLMIFGIIALFVMVSVWGLVKILTNTFFGGENTSSFPGVVGTPFK